MDKNSAIVTFEMVKRGKIVDIEIPLDISADDFVKALNVAYSLRIDTRNPKNCYMQAENPVALLKGNRTLKEFGLHHGSVIRFTE
jgi:hypothetical protein